MDNITLMRHEQTLGVVYVWWYSLRTPTWVRTLAEETSGSTILGIHFRIQQPQSCTMGGFPYFSYLDKSLRTLSSNTGYVATLIHRPNKEQHTFLRPQSRQYLLASSRRGSDHDKGTIWCYRSETVHLRDKSSLTWNFSQNQIHNKIEKAR